MLLQVVALLLCSATAICWAAVGRDTGEWSIYTYPDSPLDYPGPCGRPEASFVCDPNNILPESDVLDIEQETQEIYDGTTIPCYDSQGRKRGGFRIMVAAMPKMIRIFTSNIRVDGKEIYRENFTNLRQIFYEICSIYNMHVETQKSEIWPVCETHDRATRYREAGLFSYILGKYKWTGAQCNETTIILYSAQDGILYTSTQPNARKVLTDQIVEDVNDDVVINFFPVDNNPVRAANAIKYMLARFREVFLEE